MIIYHFKHQANNIEQFGIFSSNLHMPTFKCGYINTSTLVIQNLV
jgi:hypothetical protein